VEEVTLHIDEEIFIIKKDVLCEHSDYFRAMFSGNYIENGQKTIKIDVSCVNQFIISVTCEMFLFMSVFPTRKVLEILGLPFIFKYFLNLSYSKYHPIS
jgi:hypothetical protein